MTAWHRLQVLLVVLGVALMGCIGRGSSPQSTAGPTTPAASSSTRTPSDAGASASSSMSPSPEPGSTAPTAEIEPPGETIALPAVLASPTAAARADRADLATAALAVLDEQPQLVVDGEAGTVADAIRTGPVVVADATVDDAHVEADVVVGLPDPDERVVLRTLGLTGDGSDSDGFEIEARVAGTTVPVQVEGELGRVVVDLADVRRDDGVVMALRLSYPVVDRDELSGGAAANYGLLADHGDVVTLGHWLPAVVGVPGNDGALPAWGDLGAFDAGAWFVRLHHEGDQVRTGGVDLPCAGPTGPHDCTQAIGLGLRDLAAALVSGELRSASRTIAGGAGTMRATWAPAAGGADGEQDDDSGDDDEQVGAPGGAAARVAELSTRQLEWLADQWGPLPWPEHDVVPADISPALGMEFPGMIFVDDEEWSLQTTTGEFVLIHEWAHQYFHALVGNGSLSDPVVDESLAQYASWRWYLDQYGQGVAQQIAGNLFDDSSAEDVPSPGLPAGDFDSAEDYSTAIYRTAAQAWVDAANTHGVAVVDEIVATLVERHSLVEEVALEDVLAIADEVAPAVGADLRGDLSGA